jgi:hypothetical protein
MEKNLGSQQINADEPSVVSLTASSGNSIEQLRLVQVRLNEIYMDADAKKQNNSHRPLSEAYIEAEACLDVVKEIQSVLDKNYQGSTDESSATQPEKNRSGEPLPPSSTSKAEQQGDGFEFAEFCGEHFLKVHGGWMKRFDDQRDIRNLRTTEDVYKEFLMRKKLFSSEQKAQGSDTTES